MKKYLFGLLVAAFALATSAFTATRNNSKVSKTAVVWNYSPSGIHTATSDPEAYTQVTTENPGVPCEDELFLCKITADPDPMDASIPALSNGDPGVRTNNYSQEYKAEQ